MSLTTLSKDYRNPLYQQLPTNANPTDILAARFAAWRAIIRGLITYLKDVISVHEESVLQQVRLQHSISSNFPLSGEGGFTLPSSIATASNASSGGNGNPTGNNTVEEINNIKKFFLPFGSGSIVNIPNALNEYHKLIGSYTSRTSKELANNVIPRLEDLRRDLAIKIKEIKNLSSDFKNTIAKEVAQTKVDLTTFYNLIDQIKSINSNNLLPRQDPFLTKIYLDKQIKKQLLEENYLHEAFLNIQTSGKELEKLVVLELQNALKIYARLIGEESQVIFNVLIPKLDNGFVTKTPEIEWDAFVKQNPNNFINTELKMRKFADISYKYINDPLTLEIRSSYLERRSKFLKSYSRGWYVLTPTFIHEFKSSDRKKDVLPIMSLSLDDCQVAEHSKKDSTNPNTWHKFVLHTKQNGIIHRGHNWVFRAESYDLMISWYNDIKKLTQLPTPEARAHYVAEKLQLQKQKSRRSLQIHSSSNISLPHSSTTRDDASYQSRNLQANASKRLSAPVFSQPQQQHTQGQFSSAILQPAQQRNRNLVTKDGLIITPVDSLNETQSGYLPQHQRAYSLQPNLSQSQPQSQQQVPTQQYFTVANTPGPGNLHRSVSLAVAPNNPGVNNNNSQVLLNRSLSVNQNNFDQQNGQYIMTSLVDGTHTPNIIVNDQPQQYEQQYANDQVSYNQTNEFHPITSNMSNATFVSNPPGQPPYPRNSGAFPPSTAPNVLTIPKRNDSLRNSIHDDSIIEDINHETNSIMAGSANFDNHNGSTVVPVGTTAATTPVYTNTNESELKSGERNQKQSHPPNIEDSFGTNTATFVQHNNSFTLN